jgi:hypothetical protein
VTDARGWTLLAMVGVLISVIGGLIVQQFTLLRGYLDARFAGVDTRFGAVDTRFAGLERSIDVRFRSVNERLDTLDRDVQALIRDRFGRDRRVPGGTRGSARDAGTTQPDAVEVPEDAGVDEGAGHPRLVTRRPADLEGPGWDAQGRPAETHLLTRDEAEPFVVARSPLEKDERLGPRPLDDVEAIPDQGRAHSAPLSCRQDRNRAEHQHIDQTGRRIEQRSGEGEVADDLNVLGRDQRKLWYPVGGRAERVDQRGDAALAERLLDEVPDARLVIGLLPAERRRRGRGGVHNVYLRVVADVGQARL